MGRPGGAYTVMRRERRKGWKKRQENKKGEIKKGEKKNVKKGGRYSKENIGGKETLKEMKNKHSWVGLL